MTTLPNLRAADCGHGFLPIDAEPSGRARHPIRGWQHVFLCEECRAKMNQRQVVTKEVRPEPEPKPTLADALETVQKNADARSELSDEEKAAADEAVRRLAAELAMEPESYGHPAESEEEERMHMATARPAPRQQRRRGRPRKS